MRGDNCLWHRDRAARQGSFRPAAGLRGRYAPGLLLALQAAVNIGVTTSLLPNKGLPLPFISYGGSNLVACMFGIGLLLNIYRQGVLELPHKKRVTMHLRMTPRI
ncbi:MAG: hypothetical protein DME99_06145 [Verrucomicrobia bacterium]|nr:MAG: hypothetical protein DME99_06145 [Verrucomicrobiota bacterium]